VSPRRSLRRLPDHQIEPGGFGEGAEIPVSR
jgi:hypothetical protein